MHEMNGGWYSWSGDPVNFKKAWKHIYELSRESGLTKMDIQFVFSVNSQDLPSVGNPSPSAELTVCNQKIREITNCRTFENYYPGSAYVDMMGFTLYNWGRGRSESWATWKMPNELVNDPSWNLLDRLKNYEKPIFIDEAGTTAVNFEGKWTQAAAKKVYDYDLKQKNAWIRDLESTILAHPEIIGAAYFNVDKTNGLKN